MRGSDGWHEKRLREEADLHAADNPAADYYDEYPPMQPKFEIGQYVADQGFRVPLITDLAEWQKAFDEGTAMLRSEMPQDYSGLSGLLSSEIINGAEFKNEQGFYRNLGSLVMKGLRSGELNATEYMTFLRNPYRCWATQQVRLLESAMLHGADLYLDTYNITASRWRFIEGTNVSVFADPHVEGRYHFGVLPAKQHLNDYPAIGGYQVESDEHDVPKQFRKHKSPFIARPFIEFYEEIRNLPRFDTTQCPVIEMQQDRDGNMYFLQYLKTNKKQQYIEPFDLPVSNDTLRTFNVRGITPPDGKQMRLFMAPNILTKSMRGEGIFCGLARPDGIAVQLACERAEFILHEAYLSFQNNHFDASPLYRPPLAAALSDCSHSPSSVLERVEQVLFGAESLSREIVSYLDIKVTANGREAAIESDWEPKTIAYDDI